MPTRYGTSSPHVEVGAEEKSMSDAVPAPQRGELGQEEATAGDLLTLPQNGVRVKIPAEAGVSFPEYQRMQRSMLDMVSLVSYLADEDVRDTKVHRTGRSLDHISITKASYGSPDELMAVINDTIGFISANGVQTAVGLVGGVLLGKLPGAWEKIQNGSWLREQRLDSRERREWERLDRERAATVEGARPSSEVDRIEERGEGASSRPVPLGSQVGAFSDLVDALRDEFGSNLTREQRKLLLVVETARDAYAEGRIPNELQVLDSAVFIADRGGVVDQGGAGTTLDAEGEGVLAEPQAGDGRAQASAQRADTEGELGLEA